MKSINIGIVTDIHNGKGEPYLDRHMEKSPGKLRKVVEHFNAANLDFVVNLGDTIDSGYENIQEILEILSQLRPPVYQIIGNHDFDVADHEKPTVLNALKIKAPYFEVCMGRFQFLFLDGNEISLYAHSSSTDDYKRSQLEFNRLQKKGLINANEYNGGISLKQINWINEKLEKAENKGLHSIIFCHFPIFPPDKHNLLNDSELLRWIAKHNNAKAWICGHNHEGNYGKVNNCHVVNFKALVDTPDEMAYSIVEITEEKIKVNGFGREIDRELEI